MKLNLSVLVLIVFLATLSLPVLPLNQVAAQYHLNAAPPNAQALSEFDFDTLTVDARGRVTNRRKGQARYFTEEINGFGIDSTGYWDQPFPQRRNHDVTNDSTYNSAGPFGFANSHPRDILFHHNS